MSRCRLFRLGTQYDVPLDGVHVAVRVVNFIAEVQIVQFYVNETDDVLDCMYEFPMDDTAAVCGFEVEFDDRLLIGEVREKNAARQEYNHAIARGQTAALLEENKPDMFVQRIGNIKPRSRLNVRLTYVTELQVDAETGGAIFVLPTSIAPRYSPYSGSTAIPWSRPWVDIALGRRVLYQEEYRSWDGRIENLRFHPWCYSVPQYVVNREKPGAFSLTMEVEMPSRVLSIESSTHTIKMEPFSADTVDQNKAVASFWNKVEPLDKDVVINIYQEKPFEPCVQLEVAPDGSGCAMLSMVPEFEAEPEPMEIVFLVDCSGSMSGSKIVAARRALILFLQSLPVSCHFNIYVFGNAFKAFKRQSQPYRQDTLEQAQQFVRKEVDANMGGTELAAPLKAIFSNSLQGKARQLFVLTDGEVSNTEQVIDLCRNNATHTRVFSVGIGDQVSRHLVQGMARAATGTAEFIVGKDLGQASSRTLDIKLMNQLKLATLPSITKISVDWFGGEGPPQPSPQQPQPSQEPQQPSKFFPTGPGAMSFSGRRASNRDSSQHAVGSGMLAFANNQAAVNQTQANGRNESLYQAPFLPPPLFSGSKFVMFAFFTPQQMRAESKVNISAEAPGGQLSIQIPVNKVSTVGKSIHLLGARALVRDLTEGTSHLHWVVSRSNRSMDSLYDSFGSWCGISAGFRKQGRGSAWKLDPCNPPDSVVRTELIDVGTRFGITSKETSFIAVERFRDGRIGSAESAPELPMNDEAEFKSRLKGSSRGFAGFSVSSPSLSGGFASGSMSRGLSSGNSGAFFMKSTRSDSESLMHKRTLAAPRPVATASFNAPVSYGFAAPPLTSASMAYAESISMGEGLGQSNRDEDDALEMEEGASDFDAEFSQMLNNRKKKKCKQNTTARRTTSASASSSLSVVSLENLLKFQRFDGTIDPNMGGLSLQLGYSDEEEMWAKLSGAQALLKISDSSECKAIWVAVLFLKVLTSKYGASKPIWELAADKTRTWVMSTLQSSCGGGDIKALFSALVALA